MENIYIEATSETPAVQFESSGRLIIEGRSMPEDVTTFYNPLIEWVKALSADIVTIKINIDYMNSASSNQLLQILRILDNNNNINKLTINWCHEADDEDTLENGQIYEEMLSKASFKYYEFSEAA